MSEERGGAKSAGSPAPWATVHGVPAAAVARDRGAKGRSTAAAARGGVAGGEVAERIERGAVVAFEDEEAFRDAMDELGLLVGLGQQEVLTLVRGSCVGYIAGIATNVSARFCACLHCRYAGMYRLTPTIEVCVKMMDDSKRSNCLLRTLAFHVIFHQISLF